jgi:hypothetical protein
MSRIKRTAGLPVSWPRGRTNTYGGRRTRFFPTAGAPQMLKKVRLKPKRRKRHTLETA